MPEIKTRAALIRRRPTKSLARRSAIVAAAGSILIAGMPGPATAATASGEAAGSAVVYWAFRNFLTNDCLSTYASGAIRMRPCDADSKAQEWHWIRPDSSDGGYRLLKNRWTGKCLKVKGRETRVESGDCDAFGGNLTTMHWRTEHVNDPVYKIRNDWSADHLVPGPDGVYITHIHTVTNAKWYVARRT